MAGEPPACLSTSRWQVKWLSKCVSLFKNRNEERDRLIYLSYALSFLAILLMVVDVVLAFRLRRALIGGEVRSRWGLVTSLMLLFLIGYILSPLLLILSVPLEVMSVVAFVIFLGGAAFILIVVRILRDILSVVGMLED